MKIGIAVPAYIGHIDSLFNLLDSIQKQTIIPDKVVVSCSSSKNSDFDIYFEKINKYTFNLEIITNEDKKCAAENRNIAASKLNDVDYISFIDADDTMHPQRTEILLKTFQENDSDIILHNYFNYEDSENNENNENNEHSENDFIKNIETPIIRTNSLKQCYSGCVAHKIFHNSNDKIHHGHVSIKYDIFNKIQFPEEPEFYRKEDCVFCFRVFNLENIKDAYIANELTCYKPSNTQILYF